MLDLDLDKLNHHEQAQLCAIMLHQLGLRQSSISSMVLSEHKPVALPTGQFLKRYASDNGKKAKRSIQFLIDSVENMAHATFCFSAYCKAYPDNADLDRDITPIELMNVYKAYLLFVAQKGDKALCINNVHSIFAYIRSGDVDTFTCSDCGTRYVAHSKTVSKGQCPFCRLSYKIEQKSKTKKSIA